MKSSPTTLLLLFLKQQQQQQQQLSPRLQPPALCSPRRASLVCVHPASAPAASPGGASQPSASSGAPACPPSPRPTPPTARRVTPAGRPTVSPLVADLLFYRFVRFDVCLVPFFCLLVYSALVIYLLIPVVVSQRASSSLHHEHIITITRPSLLPYPPHE